MAADEEDPVCGNEAYLYGSETGSGQGFQPIVTKRREVSWRLSGLMCTLITRSTVHLKM